MSLPNELSVNLGLPATPITQDKDSFQDFVRIYNAIRTLAEALDRYTGAIPPETSVWSQYGTSGLRINGVTKLYLPAYTDLAVSNTVGFYNDAGIVKAKKAKDGVLKARGFVSVAGNAGATVEITLIGLYPSFAAGTLTPGNTYYQSATDGTVGNTGAQAVGYAITDQLLFFNPSN